MLRNLAVLACAVVTAASPAAWSADLLYRYKPADAQTLSRFDGQPYWRVLATCAGLHGVLSNRAQTGGREADAAAARARGVAFLSAARIQAGADRALTSQAALDLITPAVQEGREQGAALVTRPGGGYTPEQVIDAMCAQVSAQHATAAPIVGAAPAVVAEEDRIVCRSIRVTTSRFPVRECLTEAQRQSRAAQARADKEREFRSGRGNRRPTP
jgi:hypothetical protein